MHFLRSSWRVLSLRNTHRHFYRVAADSDTPRAVHHTIRSEKPVAPTPDEVRTTEFTQTSGVALR
jgi:hypothetical protein